MLAALLKYQGMDAILKHLMRRHRIAGIIHGFPKPLHKTTAHTSVLEGA